MSPLDVVKEHRRHFDPEFVRELPDLLHVYAAIEAEALKVSRTRKDYAIDNLVGYLRWHTAVSEGKEFKVNDHHSAYYARLFHFIHPTHRIFRLRLTAVERAYRVQPPR